MMSEPKKRKPRADALRNREHILAVAREAYAGGESTVTLEEIVRRSGVGVGTLYRHFPTRDALVEALYRSELEKLVDAEKDLAERLTPIEALRAWMLLFIDLMATKMILREAMSTLVGGPDELYAASGEMIRRTVNDLVERAVSANEIRMVIEPIDLLRAISGVANSSPGPNWEDSARWLVDVLIAGVRVRG
jgi:AcrR family transcriptional regulator